MDEYIGIIKMFVGTYAPEGYMLCDGRPLNVNQYQALYSIIGNQFGGTANVNFNLPDLRGRVVVGVGGDFRQGVSGGVPDAKLTATEMPTHTHTAVFTPQGGGTPITASVKVNAGTGGTATANPTGAYWGQSPSSGPQQSQDYTNQKNVLMATDAVQVSVSGGGGITGGTVTNYPSGAGQPFSIMQPYMPINFIICVSGIYPPNPS